MKESAANLVRLGRAESSRTPHPLRAGPLTAMFEPDTGILRHVRIGDHEVVRGVYGAVRDQNWNTISPRLTELEVKQSGDSFEVRFLASCEEREIQFAWHGTVTGTSDGRITYRFEGEARSSFLRNRIGLCVLHPTLECAGKPCRIEHTNGTVEEAQFPRFVAPHQPAKAIRAIQFEPAPGVRAEVRMEGDVFEMEDQRNWTDASFKTYSTPLELPFPVYVQKGARIIQTVTISFVGTPRRIFPVLLGRPAQLSITTASPLPMPPVGFGINLDEGPLSDEQAGWLRLCRPAHLRVDLELWTQEYPERLRRAAAEALRAGCGLHAALFVSDNAEAELDSLRREVEGSGAPILLWLIFHRNEKSTSAGWIRMARKKLGEAFPGVLFAAGTNAYFAELNRARPDPELGVLPCFSVNPQVHAFDETTLVENLAAQQAVIESAGQFSSRPAVISPVTLRPRFNPNATAAESDPAAGRDPRQVSLFGACWTLGSLGVLGASGAHSLTYYETHGPRGIMGASGNNAAGEPFSSRAAGVYPLFHVFADLADGQRIYATHSSHPLQMIGLTLHDSRGARRILVANLLPEEQEIKIKSGTARARMRLLDETTAEIACTQPERFRAEPGEPVEARGGKIELRLRPYAWARLDLD